MVQWKFIGNPIVSHPNKKQIAPGKKTMMKFQVPCFQTEDVPRSLFMHATLLDGPAQVGKTWEKSRELPGEDQSKMVEETEERGKP